MEQHIDLEEHPLVTGGGGTFQYNNPADFDGITGANIAKAAGYAITTGIFRDGARSNYRLCCS